MDPRPRIALLIDADNVTPDNVSTALEWLDMIGETSIRRAYGNWFDSRLKRWETLLRDKSIRSMQQFGYTRGKNATDMALVIDAVSLLHDDRPDAFAIVSSDADFTPLVIHLKERGLPVYGCGREDTPKPFQDACTDFKSFAAPAPAKKSAAKKAAVATGLDPQVTERLRKAVANAAGKNGWARIQSVRSQLGSRDSFNPSDYGHSTLTKLIKSTGAFELQSEGSPAVTVRVKNEGG